MPTVYTMGISEISIHAPRAGSDASYLQSNTYHDISIHAPRAGSDDAIFLAIRNSQISIHAPRAGSDLEQCYQQ